MKIEELLAREAIRHTLERYVSAVDRNCYAELSEVFTPDGVIIFSPTARYEGRAEIIARMTENARNRNTDHARTATYLFVASELGFETSGVYLDQFTRVEDRWLITERRANLEWGHPDSRIVKIFSPTPTPKPQLNIGFVP
jgi:SnoaL-like domain